jgi:hypothetical protein
VAATIAICEGYDSSRIKKDHRLGSQAAKGIAQTWRTQAVAYVRADGSGYIEVGDLGGNSFHYFEFGPESER